MRISHIQHPRRKHNIMEFLYMVEQEAVADHIAGDQSASCTWAVGTRSRTPHGKAGKGELGPDGRIEAGRRRSREKVSQERWRGKNRSADRNEGLEVKKKKKRQRGSGVGVVDTRMLQSWFYPSFLSPRSALDGTAESPPGLIPLPFSLRNIVEQSSGVICLRDAFVRPAPKWKVLRLEQPAAALRSTNNTMGCVGVFCVCSWVYMPRRVRPRRIKFI